MRRHRPSSRVDTLGAAEVRRALVRSTAAYVLGTIAHATFIFYLAPIALRTAGLGGYDAWVFSGVALAMALGVLPAGALADRHPRRKILRGGLALLALSYAPLLVPVTLAGVLVATALSGLGLALLFVSFNAYVGDLLARAEVSAAFGTTSALAILASAAGPFLAAAPFRFAASDAAALRFDAALFGLLALAATALTFSLPAARLPAESDEREAAKGWRGDARIVGPMAALYLLMGVGYGMTLPYFAVFFLDHLALPPGAWGVVLGLATLAGAAGSYLAGRLGHDRPATVAVGTQALHAVASTAFLLPLAAPALAAAYVGRHFLSTGVAPVVNATLARVRPASRARAQGFASLAWNAGWAAGAAAGGVILARSGGAVFPLGATLALVGVAAGFVLLRRAERRSA